MVPKLMSRLFRLCFYLKDNGRSLLMSNSIHVPPFSHQLSYEAVVAAVLSLS